MKTVNSGVQTTGCEVVTRATPKTQTALRAPADRSIEVPKADAHGRQQGVMLPGDREYKANYKAVSATEAVSNMIAREKGTMEHIPGGITDPEVRPAELEPTRSREHTGNVEDVPGFDDDRGFESFGGPEEQVDAPVQGTKLQVSGTPSEYKHGGAELSRADKYLQKRCRVTLDLADGSLSVEAIAMMQTAYSITVLLPMTPGNSIFIPKPGSEITIRTADVGSVFECFFPGSYFEVEDLQLIGLVFIKTVV